MSLSWPLPSLSALLPHLNRHQPRRPLKGSDGPLKTFPLFPLLPPEIRQHIFTLSLLPRTVELQLRRTPRRAPLLHWTSPSRPPALLGVCTEARAVALQHYTLAFQAAPHVGRGIWCDFRRDIFVFGHGTWFGEENAALFPPAAGDVAAWLARIEVLATGMVAVATQELVRFRMGQLPGLRELWLVRGGGWERRDELRVGGREVRRDRMWEGAQEGACVYLKAREVEGVPGTLGAREGTGERSEEMGVVLRVAEVVEGPKVAGRGIKVRDLVSGRWTREWFRRK